MYGGKLIFYKLVKKYIDKLMIINLVILKIQNYCYKILLIDMLILMINHL
jgi:hypothetical protein